MAKKKAMRPTWEGHLRLSLVTCPVALYTATERSADIHFNMINPETNNRIRMQTVDAGTGEPVDRADLVKGFAVSKNKYVLFDKEELDAVRLESTAGPATSGGLVHKRPRHRPSSASSAEAVERARSPEQPGRSRRPP